MVGKVDVMNCLVPVFHLSAAVWVRWQFLSSDSAADSYGLKCEFSYSFSHVDQHESAAGVN